MSPFLGREPARLEQHVVGDADLAHVVQGGAFAQKFALMFGHAYGPAQQPADLAHADDVAPGLVVLVFRGAAQAVHDLPAGLLQFGGALVHQVLQVFLVLAVFAHQPGAFKDLVQGVVKDVQVVQRLGDEVPGAHAHGRQGVLHDAHPGKHDDGHLRDLGHGVLDEGVAVHHRHVQVHHHGLHFLAMGQKRIQAFLAVGGLQGVELLVLQVGAE